VAAWNVGPFDNDDAVDWCARLESVDKGQRAAFVQRTLEDAALGEKDAPLDRAAAAVAAAATVLQSLTGRQDSESPYAPRFLLPEGGFVVTEALRRLAVEALEAVVGDGSAWRGHWAHDIEEDEALGGLSDLRTRLARPSS
jgi:hypothetical protein